jgi:hypothetical protein
MVRTSNAERFTVPRRLSIFRFRVLRRSPVVTKLVVRLALGAALALAVAHAQGAGSGEYGELPLGGSVEGTIAGVVGDETVVFHTYTVRIPAGTAAVTVTVEGFGSDLDVAVNVGRPIVDYESVDHLDVSDDPDPVFRLEAPPAGPLYIDVLNLLPDAASYRLTVTAGEGVAAATPGANPLAPGGNPLAPAAADPLVGTFEGDGLRVTVTGSSGAYRGELELGGQAFPFEASGGNGRLEGSFASAGSSYPFSATLADDVLTVESGGASYRTRRVDGAPTQPAGPLGGGAAAPAADDPVLVQGSHAALTRDNAEAFVEALEFSLQQAGFAARFSDADRRQMLDALAANYGTLGPADQAVLAQAREVWTRVQANWASASPAEQREFVLGVFVLAFGDEAVQQALSAGGAGGGGAGGSGGCATIDDCMSSYADPETYQDTVNAQGCWAAAGCEGYDPVDNSFDYGSYDTY